MNIKSRIKHWALYGEVNIHESGHLIFLVSKSTRTTKNGFELDTCSSISDAVRKIEALSLSNPWVDFMLYGFLRFDTEDNCKACLQAVLPNLQQEDLTLRDILLSIDHRLSERWMFDKQENDGDKICPGIVNTRSLFERFRDGRLLDEFQLEANASK